MSWLQVIGAEAEQRLALIPYGELTPAGKLLRGRPHRLTLGYTTDDDGVRLTCVDCGYGINLGFNAIPDDAVLAEHAHQMAAPR